MPIGKSYPSPAAKQIAEAAAKLPPYVHELDLCAWVPFSTASLQRRICEFAHAGIGVLEEPPGSNRGHLIDRVNREAGVPESLIQAGQAFWCASWVRWRYRLAGADYPRSGSGSCDTWMAWAKQNGTWRTAPDYGYAVVYGKPGDASHIGIVTRLTPGLFAVEANTTVGGDYSRNGEAVVWKPVARERVLGYIQPVARS